MVELLQVDGRLSIASLARDLGVTEVTARRKLKRLLDDGIIQVVATVDPFDVGYESPVIVGLKVEKPKLDQIARQLSELPQVRYVGASTGRVDLIIEVVVRTNQDLADFLLDELGSMAGVIDTETNLIVRIYKQAWSWAIRDD
jgi:Lrp/AsnC family transcriptional regulator for asnA, asnC and gidA